MKIETAIGLLAGLLLAASATAAELIVPPSDGTRLDLPQRLAPVPAPQEVLGYPLGDRFTHWSAIVDYLHRLARASPRVKLWEYGRSWEGRPLLLLAISSPRNIARLDEVRARQMRLAEGAQPADGDPVIVWLGYGVHGNEPSAVEAAVATAYLLAAAGGEWRQRLAGAVVLIDPLANPDGHERYVGFFEGRRGRVPDPLVDAAEHWEPWPGGRRNHYLIDLNRDWAWGTQIETRGRLAAYRRWEPQVHVDFHEMDVAAALAGPTASRPVNAEIADHDGRWVRRFAEANAAALGRYGWAHPDGGRHDLHYPGYGDSYPALRGAVGMTYEVAGHGRAGEALRLPDGGLLTLGDRIARHLTTSLATVATAAEARDELLRDFAAGRRRAVRGPDRCYLWETAQPEAAAAAELLELHGVVVRRLAGDRTLAVRPLAGEAERPRSFAAGTWVVNSRQPLGALIRALLEPDSPLPEDFLRRQRELLEQSRRSEFSDITSWSIPLAYNLEVWAADGPVPANPAGPSRADLTGEGKLGYLAAPQGLAGFRLIAALISGGLRFRVAVEPFSSGGDYPAGTVFVPRVGNPERLEEQLAPLAERHGVALQRVATAGASETDPPAWERLLPVRPPRVALVGGDGVSPASYGTIWHLLDRDLELPHHRLETRLLHRAELSRFDLIVLPAGFGYDRWVERSTVDSLGRWVEDGGLLVAVGGAIAWLRRHGLTDVEAWRPDDGNGSAGDEPARRRLHVPGAALATEISPGHPLAAGLPSAPAELFVGREILLARDDPRRDVLRAAARPMLAGFAWPEAVARLEGALLVGVQPRGRGAVVLFAQEPAFRLFWRAKLPLFLNAVIFGPSLNEAGRLAGR